MRLMYAVGMENNVIQNLVETAAAHEEMIRQLQADQITLQAILGLLMRHLPQETANKALFEAQALAELMPHQGAAESLKRVLPPIQKLASIQDNPDDTAH